MVKTMKSKTDAEIRLISAIIETAESLDWECEYDSAEDRLSIRTVTSAGEDISHDISCHDDKKISELLVDIYDDFDEEEHVELWINARNKGVPGVPNIFKLVDDAKEIKGMYEDLMIAVAAVENKVEGNG